MQIISFAFSASSFSLLSLFARADFFMEKLNLLTRSEIASTLKSFAPLKVAYQRFLYNSVMAFLHSFTPAPKNIPRTPKNCMETKPLGFQYRNISYKSLRLIFSSPSRTSLSGTINNPFVKGNLPLLW